MMHIPAGPFWMGCRDGFDTDELTGPCADSELPSREVIVSAFWIDKHEVTKGAYRQCIEAGSCEPTPHWDAEWYQGEEGSGYFVPGLDDMPAASATWSQASTYCAWLGKRLPTEAEWEKAARGTDGRKYPWGMQEPTCDHANYKPWDINTMTPGPECWYREMYQTLTPVGMFCALGVSPYGLCDTSGNTSEWVADGYESQGLGYEGLPALDPVREPTGNLVVRRGSNWGSWDFASGGYTLRACRRLGAPKNSVNATLEAGFRCAKSD
ncbi:SUMF1/EgtB/PvdO family nonheme iron enzyme [Nannocystis sp. ILAH1]|uniref:formylglycine-generating enzyme family protein n=1 Tax=unclassified Nannocystis TaxID=2627009 RepID=UPI00226E3D6E|nr:MULTISPECIES: SUMF1/EgtB/PvdO family nonheme iron enzyme [unclassified Nannocystis]MCY0994046.1 SUMF1/EgtB/PvdO family nonheme iron enzyme [Nannocystis sp. ILAH1]MCY1067014.1 SUMF1/EgtB/PvdO family nonheme iron enzyme [Nannocystis sp. RBIL2]